MHEDSKWEIRAEYYKKKVSTLCWCIGAVFYLLFGYVAYRIVMHFPVLRDEYELLFSVLWIPIGIAAMWAKNKIEDWADQDLRIGS